MGRETQWDGQMGLADQCNWTIRWTGLGGTGDQWDGRRARGPVGEGNSGARGLV